MVRRVAGRANVADRRPTSVGPRAIQDNGGPVSVVAPSSIEDTSREDGDGLAVERNAVT